MNASKTNSVEIIRKLIDSYNHKEIERCVENQINTGCNACLQTTDDNNSINTLAKAGFIHSLTVDGYSINGALRELGRRMRAIN